MPSPKSVRKIPVLYQVCGNLFFKKMKKIGSQVLISGPPLAEKCTVARGLAARATRALASCHCRRSFKEKLQCGRERIDQNVKKVWVRQHSAWPVVDFEDNPTAR